MEVDEDAFTLSKSCGDCGRNDGGASEIVPAGIRWHPLNLGPSFNPFSSSPLLPTAAAIRSDPSQTLLLATSRS